MIKNFIIVSYILLFQSSIYATNFRFNLEASPVLSQEQKQKQKIEKLQELVDAYKGRLIKLNESIIQKLPKSNEFDSNFDYSTLTLNYSEAYGSLLSDAIDDFEKIVSLEIEGKSYKDVMTFFFMGSFAASLAVPGSDVEFGIIVDKFDPKYFSWISKLVKFLTLMGVELDKENLFPTTLSHDNSGNCLKKGSFLTVGTVDSFIRYYDILYTHQLNNHYSIKGKFSIIYNLIENVDLQHWYMLENIEPEKRFNDNGYSYTYDPTHKMLTNLVNNFNRITIITGNKDLNLNFYAAKNAKIKEYNNEIKWAIRSSFETFKDKQITNFLKLEIPSKVKLKNSYYRPVYLSHLLFNLLKHDTKKINKVNELLEILKNYTSYLRLNVARMRDNEGFNKNLLENIPKEIDEQVEKLNNFILGFFDNESSNL